MRTMISHDGKTQVYEGYTVTVTYHVRAIENEWDGDGWRDKDEVLEAFLECFGSEELVDIGIEAGVTDYKIEREE